MTLCQQAPTAKDTGGVAFGTFRQQGIQLLLLIAQTTVFLESLELPSGDDLPGQEGRVFLGRQPVIQSLDCIDQGGNPQLQCFNPMIENRLVG